jgi:biotin transport system substrate-specific component
MLLANVVIYIPGLLWFYVAFFNMGAYEGFGKLLEAGMIPFLLGDLLKALLAAMLLSFTWQILERR